VVSLKRLVVAGAGKRTILDMGHPRQQAFHNLLPQIAPRLISAVTPNPCLCKLSTIWRRSGAWRFFGFVRGRHPHGQEVAFLPLGDVKLDVLAACESGLGVTAGGERVLGNQRAF
jgi:hypothetical protein